MCFPFFDKQFEFFSCRSFLAFQDQHADPCSSVSINSIWSLDWRADCIGCQLRRVVLNLI